MRTRVKDFIEISDYTSLDRLITTLVAIRDSLPESADPELKMRGDDVFGRRLSISYFRELTVREAELHDKYHGVEDADATLDALTEQLGSVEYKRRAA
ncbi:hypothetical protein M8312_13715 [Sphingomonas sp. KRR8]|uniref:hypothetical protein n=1 Tax=Sphingomonas sp. KRR8 TaxID=2942996 RepID=UPI00202034DA|nr:hypothetical protein [Sphingomonas sp. KRR8]URD60816.1 hypothetical protein M8312_13715 [Sphingomonas sp. KRR8]